ncbi:unnamed protein product [Boreogadus saida]
MTALRQRKGSRARDPPLAADIQKPLKTNCCPDHRADSRLHGDWSWGAIVWTSIGWSVSVGLGLLCCIYVATLHENDLWFSSIKEVEREISFRTECGLYYSYYKQMLQAPTIGQGRLDIVPRSCLCPSLKPLETVESSRASSDTPQRAVFAGSMQLLAGIKLCTGRVLTNHPHYEDRDLRERTKQVYQVYAQRSPEEVHRVLRAAGADYVVLEDSVCYERRHARGCRLRDLLDLDNGHIMDGPGENDPDLVPASNPRFCDAVKTDSPVYSALFTQAFRNKTFHVYRLKKKRKRGSKSSAEPTRTH